MTEVFYHSSLFLLLKLFLITKQPSVSLHYLSYLLTISLLYLEDVHLLINQILSRQS